MTLDDFVGRLGELQKTVASADAELINKLEGLAKGWLANDRTAHELVADLERLLLREIASVQHDRERAVLARDRAWRASRRKSRSSKEAA